MNVRSILRTFAPYAAAALFAGGTAHATTLNLASYGSTNTAPSGVTNTATFFLGGPGAPAGPSYNVPTAGIWTAPIGNSSWVSNNPNDYPGGGSYVSNGNGYMFSSTFFDATPGTSSGSITVMADDTTAVYLNGTLIATAAPPARAAHCTMSTPNCTTPATFNLSGFVSGTNVLTFAVNQDFDNAMGIDYAATVNTTPTPEPGSLMLLGTGLLGLGTKLYRRHTA